MKIIRKYHLVVIIRHRVFSRIDGWHTYFYPVCYSLPAVKGHNNPSISLETFKRFISKHDFCSLVNSEKPYRSFLSCDGCFYSLDLFDRYQLFNKKVKTRGLVSRCLQYSSDYDYVHPRNGFDV